MTVLSRNNFLNSISTLFKFAKRKKYLPADHDEMEQVDGVNDDGGEITFYSPVEMRELLSRAKPAFVPFLTIGAFAGVRSAEMERLKWSKINFATGMITIDKDIAKTSARRTIPISKNLAAWIAPLARAADDFVVPFEDIGHQIRELCKAVHDEETGEMIKPAIVWKHNALRHSFVSYRLAETKNAALTSLEAGNSPRIIKQNCDALVGPDDAQKWFSIMPEQAENILQISQVG